MEITWKEASGVQPETPKEVDLTSSPDTVYLRKNIKKTKLASGENEIEGYSYQEAQLTLEQFEQYQREQLELNSEAFKVHQANERAIMEGLADIYLMLAQIGG